MWFQMCDFIPYFLPRLFGACLILGEIRSSLGFFFPTILVKHKLTSGPPPCFMGKIHGSRWRFSQEHQAIDIWIHFSGAAGGEPASRGKDPRNLPAGLSGAGAKGMIGMIAMENKGLWGWSPWEMILFFWEKNQDFWGWEESRYWFGFWATMSLWPFWMDGFRS